jgi:hypothetical protein
MMTEEEKSVTLRYAAVIDEVARRIRLPNPDPKLLEVAAEDLEQMARELRFTAQ